jgi:hypothetical protein
MRMGMTYPVHPFRKGDKDREGSKIFYLHKIEFANKKT